MEVKEGRKEGRKSRKEGRKEGRKEEKLRQTATDQHRGHRPMPTLPGQCFSTYPSEAISTAAATRCYVDLELASGEYRYTPL